MKSLIAWLFGFLYLKKLYQKHYNNSELKNNFWNKTLELFNIKYSILNTEKIPKTGPVIIVCNHPFGLVDGLIIADTVSKKRGDYRILIIHGKPFPFALARIPQGGSFKGNLAAGGIGEARELSDDQLTASLEIGKVLMEEGIIFAGIDMIGNYLTEINITSPTGAREILTQTGKNPIKTLLQSI